jgi:hypothetical protein
MIPGEAADYGTAVHEAAEQFIKHGKPIPEKFAYMRPIVELAADFSGEKHTELEARCQEDGYWLRAYHLLC